MSEEKSIDINLDIENNDTMEDLVRKSINEFNKIFEEENVNSRFSLNFEKYQVKPAKKNGKPNSDLPGMM